MPLYEYQCQLCGHRFEKIQSYSAPDEKECPKCAGAVERLISAPAIQFKGAGWYVNDYGGRNKAPAATSSSSEGGSKDGGSSNASAAGKGESSSAAASSSNSNSGSGNSGSSSSGSSSSGSSSGASNSSGSKSSD